MGTLIQQFFDALEAWSQQTAASDEIIRQIVLNDVGSEDENDFIEDKLSAIQERLEALVEDIHLSERFLIVSLIYDVERVFNDQLAEAMKGENSRVVIRASTLKEQFIERATEQEKQTPSFQKRLGFYEAFEREVFPTPEKRAKQQLFLDTWREVTAMILHLEN